MRLIALLVCCATALMSAEPSALDRSKSAAATAQAVRITFTQTKELAILDQPLVSTGCLEIDRPHARLRWQFDHGAVLVLADGTLRRWGADGHEEDLSHDPSAQAMAGQMKGFLLGDWNALDALFALTADQQRIRCTPRTSGLARYLEELVITVDASGSPTDLTLRAPGGDVTTYRFAAPDAGWAPDPKRFLGP